MRSLGIFDLVGIGFGPANLAIAIANDERSDKGDEPLTVHFFDKSPTLRWHPGMLFRTSKLQVSFLKDLATMRNPRSRYSFLNFLFESGRLHDFINLRTFYPPRIEFDEYYRWAAAFFSHQVRYNSTVTAILPERDASGAIAFLNVVAEDDRGDTAHAWAKNITVSLGGLPHIPRGVARSGHNRIVHSGETLTVIEDKFGDRSLPYSFTIVGSGQTAGDILYFLAVSYPNAHIELVLRGYALKPQDDTHFVNELFFPEAVDDWYYLDETVRRRLRSQHRDVTHSAVDIDLLPLLYDEFYLDKLTGDHRLTITRLSELVAANEDASIATSTIRDLRTNDLYEKKSDALILATGYDRNQRLPLLKDLEPWLKQSQDYDGYAVHRNYSLATSTDFAPKVFMPGYCEPTHGFSETLLSLLPVRSQAIVDEVSDGRPRPMAVRTQSVPVECDKQQMESSAD